MVSPRLAVSISTKAMKVVFPTDGLLTMSTRAAPAPFQVSETICDLSKVFLACQKQFWLYGEHWLMIITIEMLGIKAQFAISCISGTAMS